MINTDGPLPKISCLMVTAAGRFDCLRRSAYCYDCQTYPNRELVIVNEGPFEYQQQLKQYFADRGDVRFIFLDGKYSLGSLRNIAVSLCDGDYFVQWDDDDFNLPERIAVQYGLFSKHPEAKVCYFTEQLHYYFPTKELYLECWGRFHSGGFKIYSLIPGTIMGKRKQFFERYPSGGPFCSAGEDSVLASWLCQKEEQVLLLEDTGHLMVYSYHGKNVWDMEHHLRVSRGRALPSRYVNDRRQHIDRVIRYLKLEGPIRVMGREGLAYVHEGEV